MLAMIDRELIIWGVSFVFSMIAWRYLYIKITILEKIEKMKVIAAITEELRKLEEERAAVEEELSDE